LSLSNPAKMDRAATKEDVITTRRPGENGDSSILKIKRG